MSLQRIATALGTTPQSLFSGATEADTAPVVLRAADGRVVEVSSESTESICHLLIAGEAPFHLLEFDGLPREFLEYFMHEGFEAVYVTRGRVEIDVGGDVTTLRPGDSISYSARLPHRLRSTGKTRANALLIETRLERVEDRAGALHRIQRPVRAPSPKRKTKN
jgi:quercetin dioxygenase-like cupin family protein